jgi:hypothetical protein
MTHNELIEKLGTFPPKSIARIYCPVDKTYYYIHAVYEIPSSAIVLTKNRYFGYTYSTAILRIKSRLKYFHEDIIFIYNDQTFIAL